MKDPFGRGLIAGLVGVVAINAVEAVLLALQISETPLWQAGGIVFLAESALQTPLGIAIGIFSHIFVALIVGVAIAYYISNSGKDFAVLKGIGLSLLAGFVVLTIIFPLRGLAKEMQTSPGDVLAALIDHTVFGGLAAYIVTYLQVDNEQPENALKKSFRYMRVSLKTKPDRKERVVFRKPKKI